MSAPAAQEGLACESLHHRNTDKTVFVLVDVWVRLGGAARWTRQHWCQRCMEAERVNRG